MKQLLTLFMAIAMSVAALDADAKSNQEETMKHPDQCTAAVEVSRTRARSSDSKLRSPEAAPASRFHKMLNEQEARSKGILQPSKITASGDNIFGYLGFYEGLADLPVGYYELQEKGDGKLLWRDPYFMENGLGFNNAVKVDNKIVGYILDEIFGKLFGIYYVEIDAETGELLRVEEQDIEINKNYLSVFAYDPEDEKFYGYGRVDDTMCFLSAPAWDPLNYTMIKKLSGKEMCVSMCYNPEEKSIVGINLNYQLIKIGKDGRQKQIMNLDVRNGDSYVTGMVYTPRSKVYYWNINYKNGTSSLATIDPQKRELDIYENFNYLVEYYNLMTTDDYIENPACPGRPQAGTPVFEKGNLSGHVPFTLPTKTMGGEDLKGEIEYTTYVNGQAYSIGTATIEEKKDSEGNRLPTVINAEFTVPEPGKYSFSITIKANGFESMKGSTYRWIGNDIPSNPTKVRLQKQKPENPNAEAEPGAYIVTWDAVTTGVNDGYIDTEKLEYVVKINGKEQTCSTNYLNVNFPVDIDLEAYRAEVKAVCNGLESEWVASNAVTEGVSLTLPAYITPTPDQYRVSLVLDNNEDTYTWSLRESKDPENPYYLHSDFSHTDKDLMDDWYFLPKMKFEDPESFYAFSMECALLSSYWNQEYLEVVLCREPSAEEVVDTIIKEFTPMFTYYDKVEGLFRIPEAGDYYVAVHCKSDSKQMGVNIRNLVVELSEATYNSPTSVKDLKITPVRKGALRVNVNFHMPTTTIGNQEISPETTLEATVSSPVETKTVTGKPGEEITVALNTEQGENTFTVQVSNGENTSLITKAVVYTGVSIPATPRGVETKISADMLSMTLDWEGVTTADDGEGYINPKTVVYDIYQLDINTNRWMLYEEGLTTNTYTFEKEPESYQEIVLLGVLSRNEAGDNGELTTVLGVLGTPYDLPIVEDFEKGNFVTDPWLTSYLYNSGSWGLYYNKDVTDDKNDKGISLVAEGLNGDISSLASPRFSTKDMESVTLNLELIKSNIPNVRILAEMNGEEPEIIGEINVNDFKNRVEKFSIPLPTKYLGLLWTDFIIETEFDDDNQILIIESISIDGMSSGVSAIDSDDRFMVNSEKGRIMVSGLEGRNVTVTNVDGVVVGKQAGANEVTFNVGSGIYIVNSGDHKVKVSVR